MPNFSLRKRTIPGDKLFGFGRARVVPPKAQVDTRYSAYVKPGIDRTVLSAYLAAAFGVKAGDDVVLVLVSDVTREAHELRVHIDRIEPNWPDVQMIISWDQLMQQFRLEDENDSFMQLVSLTGSCFAFRRNRPEKS